jgi:pimeloyl-ACP methyl ester carboxylesterase
VNGGRQLVLSGSGAEQREPVRSSPVPLPDLGKASPRLEQCREVVLENLMLSSRGSCWRAITTTLLTWLCLVSLPSAQAQQGALKWEPYTLETVDGRKIPSQLGRLVVPERHGQRAGGQIELALLRIRSTAVSPGPPIVYLAGGPGGSGIALARGPRASVIVALREVADVIALDQRGTGLTKPDLSCPDALNYPVDEPGELGRLTASYTKALNACAERLRSVGVDLAAYNTEESADDLNSLRQALGVEKISIFGSSYGSHLGLAVLRRHPGSIDRAVLSGIEGPDQTLKLPGTIQRQLLLVSRLAAADPEVRKKVPDLMELVATVLKGLEAKPVAIPVAHGPSGSLSAVAVGKFDLQQVAAGLLGTREGQASIPALFWNLWTKNYSSPVVQMAATDIIQQRTGPIGSAMSYAMDCASGASPGRRKLIQNQTSESLLGGDIDFPIPHVCTLCGLSELPEAFRTPLQCAVPTLFISGSLDGRTPPENAEEVRQGFSKSDHVIIEGAGHGNELFVSSPQIKEIILQFMRSGNVAVGRISLGPIQFKEF